MSPNSVSWQSIKDEVLSKTLRDFLSNDERTKDLNIILDVEGGVVKVKGILPSLKKRDIVTKLLREQGGIFAVWDLLELPGQSLKIADLGCGGKKQFAEAVGVDKIPAEGVDIVADIEKKLPFDSASFDQIYAIHVLEHITDLVSLMNELHRILKPDGTLHILSPYWKHKNAVSDPTHVRMIDKQTFKYFCEPHPLTKLWRPLMVTASDDTVFADITPREGNLAAKESIARWFY